MKYSSIFVSLVFLGLLACQPPVSQNSGPDVSPWEMAREIEARVVPPEFPALELSILDHGAAAESGFSNTAAIAAAIEACAQQGGGKVIVPAGIFESGPIHLLSGVNLHLEEGAEIRFSTNPADYLPMVPTSFEGTELMNYSPLVYALDQENIAITGSGILHGQASVENWWIWKGQERYGWQEGLPSQLDEANRARLIQMAEEGVPVEERTFGAGHFLRPSFVEFNQCRNVWLQGVTILDAPFWVIHPFRSENVIIEGVTVNSHGPNNDGCDPEYSRNVIIKNCHFDTGDDCIAIKSGRNEDGRRVGITSERILVKDCRMADGHGGVVMGSEISAGVRDVFVENCLMDSPNLDRVIRIKTNSKRGGFVQNVYVRNVEVGQVREAVLRVNLFYATYADQTGAFIPEVNNIVLENVKVKNGGRYGILAKGFEEAPIRNIRFSGVVIDTVEEAFSLEHVSGLQLEHTTINGELAVAPESAK